MKKMRWLTYLLWLIGMVSGIAAAGILFYAPDGRMTQPLILPEEGAPRDVQPQIQDHGSFEEYERVFIERDIFETTSSFLGMPGADGMKTAEGLQPFVDLAEKYQVVGILVDQHPQAVLQDKKTKETLFLDAGDQLDGAVIDQIVDGKIILLLNDQKMELGL